MRKYQPVWGPPVDLDDPETYKHLPNTYKELDDLMIRRIGYALLYMDYFKDRRKFFPKRKPKPNMVKASELWPNNKKWKGPEYIDMNSGGYDQRQRVQLLIQDYADNRRKGYEDLMWLKEQIYMFHEEIENMC